jgi:hypothetical protein
MSSSVAALPLNPETDRMLTGDAGARAAGWCPPVETRGDDMFGRRRDREMLRAELADVHALIAAHPLASDRIRAAHEVIEENRSRSRAEVDEALAGSASPSVAELGRTQVAGLWSWWRLHRRRRKLEQRIERAGPG